MFDDPQLDCDVSGGKFAECVISTSAVDGRRPTVHKDCDPDCLGCLLH